MKVVVGNDHRGVDAKRRVVATLSNLGYEVHDLGTHSQLSVDYPDYAILAAQAVASGQADRGILICATGHGMCIAANKVTGARAVNCRDIVDAELSRTHNDSNVLCLSADLVSEDVMEQIVRKWMVSPFENGTSRHARRIKKIVEFEVARKN